MYNLVTCNYTSRHYLYATLHVLEKEETCRSLNGPENGKVFHLSDGKTAIFNCKSGYTIVGEDVLYCADGKWSSNVPKCISAEVFVDRK